MAEPARVDPHSDPSGDASGQDFGVIPGLVWAFRFHADGSADSLPADAPVERRHDGWLWLHLNLSDARVGKWLAESGLPPQALALFAQRGVRQELNTDEACVWGTFSDLARHFDGSRDEIAHLHFAMTENLLVSGRHHALTGVANVRTVLEQGGRRINSVAGLLEMIVDQLAGGVDDFIDKLTDELDAVEEGLTRNAGRDHRKELGRTRRAAARLHRELSGLRSVFQRLEDEDAAHLPSVLRIRAARLAQRLDGLDHSVVELRDRARLLQEEINAATAEASNRALNILSVLTAVFLPPTLVSGIFGMNVKGLPFTEEVDGFLWAIAILVGSVVAVWILLRRIGALKF